VSANLSLGEYVRQLRRRKRWGLQDLADSTGLSMSHLSRIENDNAVPNADTVVKLAAAIGGDLAQMLEMADCLPREVLERYVRRADTGDAALKRSAGQEAIDPGFSRALIEDMDSDLRRALARQFALSDRDVEGLFTVLRRIGRMTPAEREAVIGFLATTTRRGPQEEP
jgi:transcriptional regulator with XRE-family HTH domain